MVVIVTESSTLFTDFVAYCFLKMRVTSFSPRITRRTLLQTPSTPHRPRAHPPPPSPTTARRERLLEEGAEVAEPRLLDGQPGRHGVAAALDEDARARPRRARRGRDRRRRPSGPSRCRCRSAASAMAIAGRWKRSLRRAAIRPTTPGCQRALAVTSTAGPSPAADLGIGLGDRLLQHRRLDRLALAVEPVELGGDRARTRPDRRWRAAARRAPASPIRPPALMRGPSRKPR